MYRIFCHKTSSNWKTWLYNADYIRGDDQGNQEERGTQQKKKGPKKAQTRKEREERNNRVL